MNKWYFLLLGLLVLAGSSFGAVIFERSLGEMGYSDFAVDGPETRDCTEIRFVFPNEVDFNAEGNYAVASLHMLLLPINGKNFSVETELNGEKISPYLTKEFACDSGCWLRAGLPKELLEEGENRLELCLNNSVDVTKSVLKAESTVGIYTLADFSKEGAFVELADNKEPLIGERVDITLLLHNYGSDAGLVEMKHARTLAEDKKAYVVIDGNTLFAGIIGAGETVEVSYSIKPRVLGSISLPPAILYYDNGFGEQKQKFGEMVTINVKEPERKINAFVIKDREINLVGDTSEMQLSVKNDGRDALFNLGVYLELPEGISVVESPESFIDVLFPGQTKSFGFSVRANQKGDYKIGCKVTYTDLNLSESKCSQTSLVFEGQEIPLEFWGGIALLLVGIGVYLYIQFGK
ncbi:MAG: NEW3 domain-containing protein [archaeon]|jgi:hypothetical protein|nr:NEW3 domain-containing protein [archaeon]